MKYVLIALLIGANIANAEEDVGRQLVDCEFLKNLGHEVPGEKFSVYLPPDLGYDSALRCKCAKTAEEKAKALKLRTPIDRIEED